MTKKQRRDYENCEINEQESENSFSGEGTDKNVKRLKQWAEQGNLIQTDSRLIANVGLTQSAPRFCRI